MSDWFETLEGTLDQIWSRLSRGVADRRAPARQPTFATVSPSGWLEARTVVLRRADRQAAELDVYTDISSDKIKSLTATPRAALHIWEPKPRLQIRLQADVAILQDAEAAGIWSNLPPEARLSYGSTPSPGTQIETSLAYVKDPDPAQFAILRCSLISIDAVHLGDDHRRAAFTRKQDWTGQWLAP
ncbi:pyridoxamine 5'-phosphate oxidase family protein [Aestuariibius insulae]|uniref:pyridoxamine 5'-phosphate oxidase family protein n=1 Tax=Aestuariibius insulae TaxID=2058287 RepID=UPI00345EABA8